MPGSGSPSRGIRRKKKKSYVEIAKGSSGLFGGPPTAGHTPAGFTVRSRFRFEGASWIGGLFTWQVMKTGFFSAAGGGFRAAGPAELGAWGGP